MYSPSHQDIKRTFKPIGTFSPPPDPTCIRNDGSATVINNMNSTANNNNVLYSSPNYPIHHHSHQHDGFGGMTTNAVEIGPPRPTRSSIPYDSADQQHLQQQQPWFGTSVESSTFSPTSPTLIARENLIISPSHSATYTDTMYHTGEEDEAQQQRHMQEMFDKRRRRRESHNLVERRRRDNINERIQELCSLLPTHLLDSNTSPVIGVTGSQKLPTSINKGTILKLSVDHIKELRDQVMHYQHRLNELEQVLYHHNNKQHHGHQNMQNPTVFHPIQQSLPIQPLHPLGSNADKGQGHYNNHPSNLML